MSAELFSNTLAPYISIPIINLDIITGCFYRSHLRPCQEPSAGRLVAVIIFQSTRMCATLADHPRRNELQPPL